ncbi:MAG: outer membrane protein assembly factor BamA [Rhodomicrobium sp.]|nr:MAG: outer membrane protein assembly factor BamA [Rhodomicrobium sp.]
MVFVGKAKMVRKVFGQTIKATALALGMASATFALQATVSTSAVETAVIENGIASAIPSLFRINHAHAQSGVVRSIVVTGNRRVEPETVKTYLKFSVGDTYSAYKVDESLQSLFSTGLFADVSIGKNGGTVTVAVEENPVINKVAFEGNIEVDNASLATEVQLKTRAIYTRARVQSDIQRILDLYQVRGIFTAKVEAKIIKLPHNRVNLVFEIVEGNSTKVKSINFIGNEAFSDGQLKDVITTGESGLLSFFKSNDIYDPDRLSVDRELVRRYYLTNGYADARVLNAVADIDAEGSAFFITFTIDEGQLYSVGNVDIETTVANIDVDSLRASVLTTPGTTYNAQKIDSTIEAITLAVSAQGYAFAQVRPRVDRDPINRTINITYVIEEGPRVYIERINIYGNTRTKDHVIRREFRLVEGDAYNRLLVRNARKRLQGLGFFEKVNISRESGSTQDRVVLNVSVVEKNTGELSFGAGYSTSEGVIGDIAITERNLLGNGQFLRLKFAGSFERQQVDLSFTEPRFMDMNLAAGFDLFHKEIDRTDESGFRNRKSGGGIRLGFPVAEDIRGSIRYSFVRDELFDINTNASQIIKQQQGVANISSVGYSFTYDTRNHRAKPNKGLYLSFSQDFAGVGGDVNYLRTTAEARAYYPLWSKVTLVGRVIGGYITTLDNSKLRLTDHFFKGGETIRGFDSSGLGPRDATTGDAIGGKVFYAGTIEARFPIPYLTENTGISAAIFADAGSVHDVDVPSNLAGVTVQDDDKIRASVGGSILWDSPMGPIRADMAYVLEKADFDDEEVFRFGASTKF